MTLARRRIKSIGKSLLQAILPHQCMSCQEVVEEGQGLCPACWGKMHFITPPFCDVTGLPLDGMNETNAPVSLLFDTPPSYRKARSCFAYDEASRGIVLRYKHADYTHLTPALSALLLRAGEDILKHTDLLIPVPLHPIRLLKRQYNQAALLAEGVSKLTRIPWEGDILRRTRQTQSQGHKKKAEREENVKKAFGLNPRFKTHILRKRVCLVDDVMTSGATVQECAQVLLKGGVKDVYVLTLARVLK